MTDQTHGVALGLQQALWHGGKIRAVGAFNVLLAALAVQHDVAVLHYDQDYEHIASVDPHLRHEWVALRGSL